MKITKPQDTLINAIQTIAEFQADSLKDKIKELENDYVGKRSQDIVPRISEYKAAHVIKNLSSQVHEIIHALGIINCLPNILEPDEKIISLSLASAAGGEGIDLITDKRVAEFKFARRYVGMQVRHVYSNFVSLLIYKPDLNIRRELYAFNAERIIEELSSSQANSRLRLSKSGKVRDELDDYLSKRELQLNSVCDIFQLAHNIVEIKNIEPFLTV